MSRESAFTATGSSTGPRAAASSASAASSYSRLVWRASRSSRSPAGVAAHGLDRRTSTWPAIDSSARIRWLTALGVMCRCRAAASKVPRSTIATSAASWSGCGLTTSTAGAGCTKTMRW